MIIWFNNCGSYVSFLSFIASKMKILTWNINGIRANKIPLKKLLDSLNADVICLQETKVTRDMLDEQTAIVDGYNSYFSFSKKRSGYSGVATFCKNSVTPVKAEEGLSGFLTVDSEGSVGCYGNHSDFSADDLSSLDAEGRAVITQHRIRKADGSVKELAVINVYVPRAEDKEERHDYKLKFLALLQTRAETLVNQGSHVVLVGDINTTHRKQDHCDPTSEEFLRLPSRQWLNQFLRAEDRDSTLSESEDSQLLTGTSHTQGGMFADSFRYFYPDQENAFTNWCTRTAARQTNYGKRLDYIFVDLDLASECLVDCNIMVEVEGSDHCPVVAELCCHGDPSKKCPPLCTKFMPEFSGTQQKLFLYFNKGQSSKEVGDSDSQGVDCSQEQAISQVGLAENDVELSTAQSSPNSRKRKPDVNSKSSSKKQKHEKKSSSLSSSKQGSLMNFFKKCTSENSEGNCSGNLKCENNCISVSLTSEDNKTHEQGDTVSFSSAMDLESVESDLTNMETSATAKPLATKSKSLPHGNLSESVNPSPTATEHQSAAVAWKGLLGGPAKAPLCKKHREPCVLRTVKKEGPNKGRQFYMCARGEGFKSNPEARCDFFQWVEKKKKKL